MSLLVGTMQIIANAFQINDVLPDLDPSKTEILKTRLNKVFFMFFLSCCNESFSSLNISRCQKKTAVFQRPWLSHHHWFGPKISQVHVPKETDWGGLLGPSQATGEAQTLKKCHFQEVEFENWTSPTLDKTTCFCWQFYTCPRQKFRPELSPGSIEPEPQKDKVFCDRTGYLEDHPS